MIFACVSSKNMAVQYTGGKQISFGELALYLAGFSQLDCRNTGGEYYFCIPGLLFSQVHLAGAFCVMLCSSLRLTDGK